MNRKIFALKGDICFTPELNKLSIQEDSYLVCADGAVKGIFKELPLLFHGCTVYDYTGKLIIPGMTDLHLHAPQYAYRGLSMDMELLDWLNETTFPEESKYADKEYAEKAYKIFVKDLKMSVTTRACIFATIHFDSTTRLMELLEETGLHAYVGKVNMDRNSPDILRETTKASVFDTLAWLQDTKARFINIKPILTPRFIPSCTDELMAGLAKIQKDTGLPVQSHLSENPDEVAWVQTLCPDSKNYADAFDRFDLFGRGVQTLMAHCVYLSEEELLRMKENDIFAVHCPQSNTNLASGIAPVRRFLDLGIKTGLGSDIAGGASLSMFRVITDAVQASKLRWRFVDQSLKPLTMEEAFYLATKGGGAFFGKVGSFEEGYAFDALVLDESRLPHPQDLTVKQRLERMFYLAEGEYIAAKFINGKQIKNCSKQIIESKGHLE